MFDLGPASPAEAKLPRLRNPIWTENKAKLIQRYLRLFVMITKHGVYLDGFSGPQEADKHDMWAAKLVLETTPRWMRKFYLFELDDTSVKALEELRAAQPPRQPKEPKRTTEIFHGDTNVRIDEVLNEEHIRQKDATFCLLDQRTFECHWSTVEKVARYKHSGQNKIEIFYFVAEGWLDRSVAALKDEQKLKLWWGRENCEEVKSLRRNARADLFVERFKNELGYKHARAYPIFDKASGRRVMYYMVHATDHDEAPKLMWRAYRNAVTSEKEFEQLALELEHRGLKELAEEADEFDAKSGTIKIDATAPGPVRT